MKSATREGLVEIRDSLRGHIARLDAEHDPPSVASVLLTVALRRLLEDGFDEEEVVGFVRKYFAMPEAVQRRLDLGLE